MRFLFDKRGAINELVKILIVVVILVLLVGAVILLVKGQAFGEDGILASIKNLFKFGGR